MFNSLHFRSKQLAYLGLVPLSAAPAAQRRQRRYTWLFITLNLLLAIYGIISFPNIKDLKVSFMANQIVFVTQTLCVSIVLCEVMYNYCSHFEYCERAASLEQEYGADMAAFMHKRQCRQHRKFVFAAWLAYGSIVLTIAVMVYRLYYVYFRYVVVSLVILRTRCLQLMLHIDHIAGYLKLLANKLQAVVVARDSAQSSRLLSLSHLLKLKSHYNEIYKLSCHFNENCGWSMLALVVVMVIDIILNLYWLFLTAIRVYHIDFIYFNILAITPQLVLIFMLCQSCESCKRWHKIIANNVGRLSNTLHKQTDVAIYNDLLDEFAMQLQQDCIVITTKGFLTIDYRLLKSLITGITAYLTILMQFRISDADYIKHQSTF